MQFKINPMAYSGMMFSLPSSIIDENLGLASAVQLKAILYFFRHSALGENVTCAQIAKAIRYEEEDVADAMIFWLEKGVVVKADEDFALVQPAFAAPEPPKQVAAPAEIEKPKKEIADIPISKPSHEQVAIRLEECAEFRELFSEAQIKLGKTIGYDGQSALIMLHDSYGLPIEVILMLIEYAKTKNKTNYAYIVNLGKKWAENEIVTIESAEEYIEEQSSVDALWKEFRSLTGVKNLNPTTKQRRFFNAWSKSYEFSCEMIFLAYEISIDNTEKMSLEYMDKILKNWYDKGIKNPVDAEKENVKWAEEKKGKASKEKPKKEEDTPSYDLEAFAKKSIHLKYKKNTED